MLKQIVDEKENFNPITNKSQKFTQNKSNKNYKTYRRKQKKKSFYLGEGKDSLDRI